MKGAILTMQELRIASAGGGEIHGVIWEPEGKPKAIVQLVHGIAEHVGRYADFAEVLCSHGFLVTAEDHMGHGGSICEKTPQGCFSGGWTAAVEDVRRWMDRVREMYPGLPYILMGHSMGSFLARTFLYTYPDAGLKAAILSGTAWQPGLVLSAGQKMCAMEVKKVGAQTPSEKLQKLMFGSYNKRFGNVSSPNAWISSIPEEVRRYDEDPQCGFVPSTGLCRDMLDGIGRNQKKDNLEAMPKTLPVLFISGDMDPVGAYGKGVQAACNAFRKAGMQDVTIKLYPGGRHELLHETNREEVCDYLISWMEQKI